MIIKCRYCGKEFDKPGRRNQHEKDAHILAPLQKAIKKRQGTANSRKDSE